MLFRIKIISLKSQTNKLKTLNADLRTDVYVTQLEMNLTPTNQAHINNTIPQHIWILNLMTPLLHVLFSVKLVATFSCRGLHTY